MMQYYPYILMFVVFDVVAIFLYAWGSSLLELPKSATLPMMGFLAIIAQGKDGQPAQVAAGKQVQEAENTALLALEELFQSRRVDPGRGNMPAYPVDRQDHEGEQDAPAQIWNAEDISEAIKDHDVS